MFDQFGFIFKQKNKLTKKIQSNPSNINIQYYLKIRTLIMHRHFFRTLSQSLRYVQTHCNDSRNPFHFACPKEYLHNNPQS